jgi:hypothetical protein
MRQRFDRQGGLPGVWLSVERERAEVGAAKLVRNGKVAVRVAELQARNVRRLDVTAESIVVELEAARFTATRAARRRAFGMRLVAAQGFRSGA